MIRNKKYPEILRKHNLKLTQDRFIDFRKTMKEIVDIKNGLREPDNIDLNHQGNPYMQNPVPGDGDASHRSGGAAQNNKSSGYALESQGSSDALRVKAKLNPLNLSNQPQVSARTSKK